MEFYSLFRLVLMPHLYLSKNATSIMHLKSLYAFAPVWSKTTLITGSVGGAGPGQGWRNYFKMVRIVNKNANVIFLFSLLCIWLNL